MVRTDRRIAHVIEKETLGPALSTRKTCKRETLNNLRTQALASSQTYPEAAAKLSQQQTK
jgi:hypothetical protein